MVFEMKYVRDEKNGWLGQYQACTVASNILSICIHTYVSVYFKDYISLIFIVLQTAGVFGPKISMKLSIGKVYSHYCPL